jgi:hypothetical protein
MRDENDQPDDVPSSREGSSDGSTTVDRGDEPMTFLADFEQAMANTALEILCGVVARGPSATAADLRELVEVYPTLGGVTLDELFFGGGSGVK